MSDDQQKDPGFWVAAAQAQQEPVVSVTPPPLPVMAAPSPVIIKSGITWKQRLGYTALGAFMTVAAEVGGLAYLINSTSQMNAGETAKYNEAFDELSDKLNHAQATDKVQYEIYTSNAGDTPEESVKRFVDSIKEKSKDRFVLVDFYAEWCPPCQMIAPNLMPGALASGLDITVIKVGEKQNYSVMEAFIRSYPEMHLIKDGQLLGVAKTIDASTAETFSKFLKGAAEGKTPTPWPSLERTPSEQDKPENAPRRRPGNMNGQATAGIAFAAPADNTFDPS